MPSRLNSSAAPRAKAAVEAGKQAAEAAKKAAIAAKNAVQSAARSATAEAKQATEAAKSKDKFVGLAASAVATVPAVAAVAVKVEGSAKAELKAGATALGEASKQLSALPQVSAGVKAVADEAQKVCEQPTPIVVGGGVGASTVETVADKAKGWLEAAKEGVTSLYDSAKTRVEQGIQTLEDATKKLDGVLSDGKKELKNTTIDAPIDNLKPGDQMAINGTANAGVAVPGLNVGAGGLSIKGQVQTSTGVKMEDDGSYTIRQESGALESASVGATTQRGADVNADAGLGGSVVKEYKVAVNVKNPDGSDKLVDGKPVLDPEATRARAKEITDLLVNPPTAPVNPMLSYVAAAQDARTPEQVKMMDEAYSATEYKGTFATSAAIALNVPNQASVAGGVKGQTDFSLRVEKADVPVRDADGKPVGTQTQPGTKVTTSLSVSGEVSGEGSVNSGKVTTLNADGKLAAKTTLSTTFEYPVDGATGVTDLGKLKDIPPHVSASLTQEVDLNIGGGKGVGGDLVVAKGNVREINRIGATTVTTITVDDPVKNGAAVLQKATEGNLAEAAKVAGDNIRVTIETNIYTERSRIAEGGLKLGKGVDFSTKLEAVERHTLAKLPKVDTSVTDLAIETQKQASEVKRRLEEPNLRPVYIRG